MAEPNDQGGFSDYSLANTIMEDVAAAGYQAPTPIQAAFIPLALAGRDVIGLAQTGTGKTAAFALPIIERLAQRMEMGAVVLSPTRELARQTAEMFDLLGRSSGIRVATVVGGTPMSDDWKALASWPNVLVATPGRLIDHIESRTVSLSEVEVLVVDEADRMHDMGFMPQLRRILDALPPERQTLMLTATMPPGVERLARRHMKSPERVQIGRRSAPADGASHRLFLVRGSQEKETLLLRLLEEASGRVLVFVRTKAGVNRLARAVGRRVRSVARIHSDRSQAERDEAMSGFRSGKYRVLIATDVAARGLDVAEIERVINFDFPHNPEDYVHRIGRTARADATGEAISLVTRGERKLVAAVERLIGRRLPLERPPGLGQPSGRRRAGRRRKASRPRPGART